MSVYLLFGSGDSFSCTGARNWNFRKLGTEEEEWRRARRPTRGLRWRDGSEKDNRKQIWKKRDIGPVHTERCLQNTLEMHWYQRQKLQFFCSFCYSKGFTFERFHFWINSFQTVNQWVTLSGSLCLNRALRINMKKKLKRTYDKLKIQKNPKQKKNKKTKKQRNYMSWTESQCMILTFFYWAGLQYKVRKDDEEEE